VVRRAALAASVAIIISTVALGFAQAHGPTAQTAAGKTYSKFSHVAYKPSTLAFGAHEQITDMSWSTWAKKLAIGTGMYQVNDCLPSCAEGTITPTPATVYLTGRVRCGKHYVYKRLKVYFGGRKNGTTVFCK
jgi:hypothetical protein